MKVWTTIVIILVLLSGCGWKTVEINDNKELFTIVSTQRSRNSYMSDVIKDKQTGCEYIVAAQGITVRLDKDGKPYCKSE